MDVNLSDPSDLNETLWEFPFFGWTPVLALLYLAILLVAVPSNFFIIVVMIKSGKLRKDPSTAYLLSLAVIDFLWAILTLPFYIATAILEGFKFGPTDEVRNAVCEFQAYLLAFFFGATVHLLALVAFDRFLLIVYAFKYNRIMKTWLAWLLVFLVCIPTLVISSTPFYGFGDYFFFQACGVCLFHWRGETSYVLVYAAEVSIPVICIITFSLITFVYIRKFLRRTHRRKSRFTMDVAGASREHKTKQRALTRVFVALILVQVVCILPAILTAMIGAVSVGFDSIPDVLFQIDVVLLLSNMAVNPIVQSIFRVDVRSVLSKILAHVTCKRCRSVPITESGGTDSGSSLASTEKTSKVMPLESTELLSVGKVGQPAMTPDRPLPLDSESQS